MYTDIAAVKAAERRNDIEYSKVRVEREKLDRLNDLVSAIQVLAARLDAVETQLDVKGGE